MNSLGDKLLGATILFACGFAFGLLSGETVTAYSNMKKAEHRAKACNELFWRSSDAKHHY